LQNFCQNNDSLINNQQSTSREQFQETRAKNDKSVTYMA